MPVAGLAGGMLVTGVLLLIRELKGQATEDQTHPPPRTWRPSRAARRRTAVAVCAALIVLAISRWPVAAIATLLAIVFLPRAISTSSSRHQVAMLEGLEQWIRRVSDMLTASRGLEEALEASALSAPAAIRPAVERLARRLTACAGTEVALRAFAADLSDPVADQIAAALIIATGRRGGGVREVLNSLAVLLARDVAMRREIEAERAQHRTTVKWLIAFVIGFTLFAVLNRSYSAPYGTATGEFILAVIVAMYAAGLAWLHRLGSVPRPARFLAESPIGPDPGRST